MTELSFEKYVNFLLIQNGFKTELEHKLQDFHVDIFGWKDGKKYIFELKLYKRKKRFIKEFEQLIKYSQIKGVDKIVLITNAEIQDEFDFSNENIVLIGRNQLRPILKNKDKLIEILNKNYPQHSV